MLAERFGVDPALLRSANVGVPLPEADDVDVSQSVHSIIVPSGAKGDVATIGLEKCELEKCELVVFLQEVAESNAFLSANVGPPGFHDRYQKRCVRVDGAEGRWGDGQKHVWLHFLFSLLLYKKTIGKNQTQ